MHGGALPDAMRDHSLGGTYHGHRECHIEPDWLLIYPVDEEGLVLIATSMGNHGELLGLWQLIGAPRFMEDALNRIG